MKRFSTFIALLLFAVTAVLADGPFRNHRYDSFKVLSVTGDNIVFIGNSITDMHCWPEAFKTSTGEYLPIVNRGNSGTYSTEQSDNLESYINGKPKKVFMMIGTNDIATSGGLNFSPEQVLAYATALVTAEGSGLAPLFQQVLDSRNGRHYDAAQVRLYPGGGIGGTVLEEPVLVGPLSFLKDMGVEVPEGIQVSQAVCVAIDGELCGVFAISYEKTKSATAGLSTLSSYRGLRPMMVSGEFMMPESFIRSKFSVKTKRFQFPGEEVRGQVRAGAPGEDAQAAVLVTMVGLARVAYGVTGARALRAACNLGVVLHMVGGFLGMGIVLALVIMNAMNLLTPVNMFLYQLVWMIPGLLVTEWTRSI